MEKFTKAAFLDVYPIVRKTVRDYFVKQLPSYSPRVTAWVERVLDYNVPQGKFLRGLTMVRAFQLLRPRASDKEIHTAVRLGWSLEMLQSCFLVADDIMDLSSTRRGRPCWYKLPNVGVKAVNDCLLLENAAFLLAKDSLTDEKLRCDILNIISEAKLNLLLGQNLDSDWTPFHACTPEFYYNMVGLKTSHFFVYLPVAVALTLANGSAVDASSELEQLSYDMGYYFQVQNDYLDCYGDSMITGKEGTDIQTGKCTWFLINALASMKENGNDWRLLEENYGKSDQNKVDIIKNLYSRLRMERKYDEFETAEFKKLEKLIKVFPVVPLRVLFKDWLESEKNRYILFQDQMKKKNSGHNKARN